VTGKLSDLAMHQVKGFQCLDLCAMTHSVAGAASLFTIRQSEEPRRDPKWAAIIENSRRTFDKGRDS
jgi:hypothetical protein